MLSPVHIGLRLACAGRATLVLLQPVPYFSYGEAKPEARPPHFRPCALAQVSMGFACASCVSLCVLIEADFRLGAWAGDLGRGCFGAIR